MKKRKSYGTGKAIRQQISLENQIKWTEEDFNGIIQKHVVRILFDDLVRYMFIKRDKKKAKDSLEKIKDWL